MNTLYLIILSIIGLANSFYIYYSKKYGKPMVCVIGHDCNEVVRTKYGKLFFGIENTVMGFLYYGMILLYGILLLADRNIFKPDIVHYFLVGSSAASVAFAAYITGVQAFVLRKWCMYCIISSITSIMILAVLIYG